MLLVSFLCNNKSLIITTALQPVTARDPQRTCPGNKDRENQIIFTMLPLKSNLTKKPPLRQKMSGS